VLHARAAEERLPGSELFRAYDQCVTAPQIATLTRSELRAALERDGADAPHIWALKLRALTNAGLHDEARARLRAVAPDELANLPRDRDYLGTLGALVHAVLALEAHEYLEPLSVQLSEYPTSFAANISFVCEGSIPELMGQLAAGQGDRARASELSEQGEALCARAGLRTLRARARGVGDGGPPSP
jgi:hypothetical protein